MWLTDCMSGFPFPIVQYCRKRLSSSIFRPCQRHRLTFANLWVCRFMIRDMDNWFIEARPRLCEKRTSIANHLLLPYLSRLDLDWCVVGTLQMTLVWFWTWLIADRSGWIRVQIVHEEKGNECIALNTVDYAGLSEMSTETWGDANNNDLQVI